VAVLAGPPRPPRPDERAALDIALGRAGAADQPNARIFVDADGPAAGVALWLDTGTRALLGAVTHAEGAGPKFYALVKQCALDARAAGYTTATFTIRDQRLLRLLQRTFTIAPEAAGWEPNTPSGGAGRTAKEWTVTVDLDDALRQLAAVT
jgi:hypothetical protein